MPVVGADEFVYSNSDAGLPHDTVFPVTKKDYIQINDSNNGSYSSGQVQFDSSGLANSGAYVNMAESLLILPVVLQADLATTVTTATAEQAFFANLRNGAISLITSISLKVAGVSVVENVNMSNMMLQFRLMSEFSEADIQAHGISMFWQKESINGIQWSD